LDLLMFKRRRTGGYDDVADVRRWTGTAWQAVSFARRWNGSAWVQVWPVGTTVEFTLNKSAVSGTFVCDGETEVCPFVSNITTESVTASASSGSPTFLWQYVSGNTAITVSSPTAATVTFSADVARTFTTSAVWKCTITSGAESKELFVDVSMFYDYIRTPSEEVP
jgi:hypothetical protein